MRYFPVLLLNELHKTWRRPRSYIGFGVISFICLLLQAAFYQDGKDILSTVTNQLDAVFTIQGEVVNGNLICFVLLQTLIVQMPLLVAFVTGDAISSETASGSVRFLLTTPGSRTAILLAKWIAGLIYTACLLIVLGIFALLVSRGLFGQGDLMSMNSDGLYVIRGDDLNWRWALAFGIAFLALGVVASFGTLLSCLMDNSITPIVTVMATIIVFTIIGMFDMKLFDIIKPFLFTTHMICWRSLFVNPVPVRDILTSCGILLLHMAGFISLAIYLFRKKDIST